jgi:hypothetical protein
VGIARVAVQHGIRRVNQAPLILVGVWLLTLAVSVPAALVVRARLAQHLGDSLAADQAAAGVNHEWMQEFADQADGLAGTFRPTIIGFGAVLDNLSGFVDRGWQPVALVLVSFAYIALWLFLAGGIIDRYARDRATGAYGFFGVCGAFFFRFLRLAIAQAVVYGLLFGPVHGWLFDWLYARLIRNVTVERTAFGVRVAVYLLFLALVAGWTLLFDYAKVRAVIEDRRSVLGAVGSALGFIRRNAAAAMTVYAIDAAAFLLVIALYAAIVPGVSGAGPMMWVDLAIAQLYILARLWVKLLFWASETALFQRRLAHAGYVARPEPLWPDSPIAEAIAPLRRSGDD